MMEFLEILKDGKTGYKILTQADCEKKHLLAAEELCFWFEKATGAMPQTETDGNDRRGRYISLGDTSLAQKYNLKPVEGVGPRGFTVKTVGENIFVLANTGTGVLYGVYGLLNRLFGFEYFAPDAYSLQKPAGDFSVKSFEFSDKPAITYNIVGNGAFDGIDAARMHFEDPDWMIIGNDGEYHNSFEYLPPEKYKEKHPEWYSDDGTQLCFLAHGDEKSLEEMYRTALQTLKENLKTNLHSNRVSFTQQDETTWCTCPACTALKEKYKTDAVSMIRFVNRLGKDVREWFESDGKAFARDFDIVFFAYHPTRFPPAVKQGDAFVPCDESVVLEPNVSVYYAPISADYHYALNDEINREATEFVDGWKAVSKKLYMWIYTTNFHYYLAPYNSFSAMRQTYKYLSDSNTYLLFDENQYNHKHPTGFTVLKGYLSSKLGWDPEYDMNELTEKFFENYFGEAKTAMRKCFDALKDNFSYMEKELGYSGYTFEPVLKKELFPKKFLLGCLRNINAAKKAVSPLKKTDKGEYEKYYLRILTESLSFRYLLIELYKDTYCEKRLLQMKLAFKRDARKTGTTLEQEHYGLEKLYKEWSVL